jgi:multiple sugar transport system ATP-binding protein
MRSGLLQQFATPQELYDRPANLFVAGFIGSPAMNFLPSRVEDSALHTPLGDIPLTDQLRRTLEQTNAPRDLLVGIRPESFEDAALVSAANRDSGLTLRANIDVLESVGSDVFVYFTKEFVSDVTSAELAELAEDSGSGNSGASGELITARLDPETTAREGQETELWADLRNMHVFNPATGANITLDAGPDGPVLGGGAGGATATSATTGATQEAPVAEPPAAPAAPVDGAASDTAAGPGAGTV